MNNNKYLYFSITNRIKMAQIVSGKGINLKLPDKTYDIVFAKSLDMSKAKNRKVSLVETAIHIINEWGEQQCAKDTKK